MRRQIAHELALTIFTIQFKPRQHETTRTESIPFVIRTAWFIVEPVAAIVSQWLRLRGQHLPEVPQFHTRDIPRVGFNLIGHADSRRVKSTGTVGPVQTIGRDLPFQPMKRIDRRQSYRQSNRARLRLFDGGYGKSGLNQFGHNRQGLRKLCNPDLFSSKSHQCVPSA